MVLEVTDKPSLLYRCSVLGDEAHASPGRLRMGSGHVRCARGAGGEPDWSIFGASFRGHPERLRGIIHRTRGARTLCDLYASDSAPGLVRQRLGPMPHCCSINVETQGDSSPLRDPQG